MPGRVRRNSGPTKQACAGSGGNGCKETIETPEKTLQQAETPEPDTWYKARITKGDAVMLEAKIHPEMLALILKEVR